MTEPQLDPHRRAGDGDRDAAIRTVEEAFDAGRIVEADRDKRIEELRRAQTMGEIDLLVRDLRQAAARQPHPIGPVAAVSVGASTGAPDVPGVVSRAAQVSEQVDLHPGVAAARTAARLVRAAVSLVFMLVVGAVLLVGFSPLGDLVDGLDSLTDGDQPGPPDQSPDQPAEPSVLTPQGWHDMVAALKTATGETEVFVVVAYPGYASIEAPDSRTGDRMRSYYWNGALSAASLGQTDARRFDLRTIDPEVVVRLVRRARAQVDEPTSSYAIVRAPGPTDDGAWIYAYASNAFSEGGYVAADRAGRIVRNVTW